MDNSHISAVPQSALIIVIINNNNYNIIEIIINRIVIIE